MKSARDWVKEVSIFRFYDKEEVERLVASIQIDAICSVRTLFELACRTAKAQASLESYFDEFYDLLMCRESPTKKSVDN